MERPIELIRMEQGAGAARAAVHRTVAAFFLAGALLNGENLLATAERMEHGSAARAACIEVARPLAAVTRSLGLGLPRRSIEAWIDRTAGPAP